MNAHINLISLECQETTLVANYACDEYTHTSLIYGVTVNYSGVQVMEAFIG